MPASLVPPRREAARGLDSEPAPAAEAVAETDMELSDDELEAVVGGLARVHLPGFVIAAAQAPA